MKEESAGFDYEISQEQIAEYAKWSIKEKFKWLQDQAEFMRKIQTREERIRSYRIKGGKNVKYYDQYGWPENI